MFVQDESQQRRRCGRCGQRKPLAEFDWRRQSAGQRDNYCRRVEPPTNKSTTRPIAQRYVANALRRKRALIAERTAYLVEFFREHPCVDCGETDPLVLEFDHLARQELQSSPWASADHNWQSVLDEIEQVRRGLCKLSSTPNRPPGRIRARGGSPTVEPRPSKAMMRVRFAARPLRRKPNTTPAQSLADGLCAALPRRLDPPAAPPPAPPPPRPPTQAAAKAQTSCPEPHRASRSPR